MYLPRCTTTYLQREIDSHFTFTYLIGQTGVPTERASVAITRNALLRWKKKLEGGEKDAVSPSELLLAA